MKEQIDPEDCFRTGRAYVRLAKEEPNLFRIFILHRRQGISSLEEFYTKETDPGMANLYLTGSISMWSGQEVSICTCSSIRLGIGTIFCTTAPGISLGEVVNEREAQPRFFGYGAERCVI